MFILTCRSRHLILQSAKAGCSFRGEPGFQNSSLRRRILSHVWAFLLHVSISIMWYCYNNGLTPPGSGKKLLLNIKNFLSSLLYTCLITCIYVSSSWKLEFTSMLSYILFRDKLNASRNVHPVYSFLATYLTLHLSNYVNF